MKILVADAIDDAAISKIKAHGIDVTVSTGLTPDALCKVIPSFSVLAVRSATKVTKPVIDAGKNLRLIVRAGVGLDTIDTAAAAARGIEVKNTAGATTISVAEHVMGLILSLARFVPAAHISTANGKWEKNRFVGHELAGKTLGIVGFGRIGRQVAKRARAFDMHIIVNDPLIEPDDAAELNVPLLSLQEVLRISDVITLHLPFAPETKNLLGEKEIHSMKKGAWLINCARGGLVDETALAKALTAGHLGGAAFDVFAEEPLSSSSPLRQAPNMILTPHIAASTLEAQHRAGMELADIVIAFSQKKT